MSKKDTSKTSEPKFENIDYKILGMLGIVTAIVATWRSESVFLIILIPVFTCISICKKINTVAVRKKMIIFFLVVSLLPFGVFRNINQLENEKTQKNSQNGVLNSVKIFEPLFQRVKRLKKSSLSIIRLVKRRLFNISLIR